MKLRVQIASVPDRDNLVAEIWFGDQQLAEISHETEAFKVEIYHQSAGNAWVLDFDEFIDALQEAKRSLISS